MRAPCSLLLLLVPVLGCEPMDDPGSPWSPVPVSAQAPAAGTLEPVGALEVPVVDPMFDVPEPVVIHSSELGQAGAQSPADPAVDGPDVDLQPAPAEEAVAEAEPAPVELAQPDPAHQGFAQLAPAAVGGWPLRLVATVPGAQPPRAILGLPGGAEVVVTPGTMLPDAGVVVMAIGSGSVDLAEVRPAGDNAVVSGRTLQSQRGQRLEITAAQ